MSSPTVTVIIPNYNHSNYLSQRIESVLFQTYPAIEIIVLDDCSTDSSRDIINEYAEKDSRIQTIYNDRNSGSTFSQWNKGIALAKGEYIWIAESDDYSDIHFLEILIRKFKEEPEVGLVYCDSWYVYQGDNSIKKNHTLYEELDAGLWNRSFVLDGRTLLNRFMSYSNLIPNASAAVFQKSVAQKVGPADASLKLTGDWIYWASIFAVTKVAYIAEPLNYFRQHNNNVRNRTFLNGVYFVELSHVMGVMQKYGSHDDYLLNKSLETFFRMWLQEDQENRNVNYKIPLTRHYNIFSNLLKINASVRKKTLAKIRFFVYANSYRWAKEKVGNGTLYKFLRILRTKKI